MTGHENTDVNQSSPVIVSVSVITLTLNDAGTVIVYSSSSLLNASTTLYPFATKEASV